MQALGNCYEAAAQFVMDKCMFGDDCPYTIVHAEVAGQGQLEGTNFGHAYVVDKNTGNVIDRSNGRNVVMPRAIYEMVGAIKQIGNYHEYTWKVARLKMVEHEHYGPWDLETSTGL